MLVRVLSISTSWSHGLDAWLVPGVWCSVALGGRLGSVPVQHGVGFGYTGPCLLSINYWSLPERRDPAVLMCALSWVSWGLGMPAWSCPMPARKLWAPTRPTTRQVRRRWVWQLGMCLPSSRDPGVCSPACAAVHRILCVYKNRGVRSRSHKSQRSGTAQLPQTQGRRGPEWLPSACEARSIPTCVLCMCVHVHLYLCMCMHVLAQRAHVCARA